MKEWKLRAHQQVFIDLNSFFVWIALTCLTMSMVDYGMYGEKFRQTEEWQEL